MSPVDESRVYHVIMRTHNLDSTLLLEHIHLKDNAIQHFDSILMYSTFMFQIKLRTTE